MGISFKLFLILIAAFFSCNLLSQAEENCLDCECIEKEAMINIDELNFVKAINLLNAVKVCDPTSLKRIDDKIIDVFKKIEAQKNEALQSKRELERQRKITLAALQQAELDRENAIKKSNVAEANRLAAISQQLLLVDENYLDAFLLAYEGYKKDKNPSTSQSLALSAYSSIRKNNKVDLYRSMKVGIPPPPKEGNVRMLAQPKDQLTTCIIMEEANTILTVYLGKEVKLWNTDGELIKDLIEHYAGISAVAVSGTHNIIALASAGEISIWDGKGNYLNTIPVEGAQVIEKIILDGDGKSLLYVDSGKKIVKASFDGGLKESLIEQSTDISDFLISKDGKNVVTSSLQDSIRFFERVAGRYLFSTGDSTISSYLKFSEIDSVILSVQNSQMMGKASLSIYDKQGEKINEADRLSYFFYADFYPLNNTILLSSSLRGNLFWNYADSNFYHLPIEESRSHIQDVTKLISRAEMVFSFGGYLQLFSYEDYSNTYFDNHDGYIVGVDASDILGIVASIDEAGICNLWKRGRSTVCTIGKGRKIFKAKYSPDGKQILGICADSTARLWDKDGQLIQQFHHSGSINQAEFLPSRMGILTSSYDSTTVIWNENGDVVQRFRNNVDGVAKAIWSPDLQHYVLISNSVSTDLRDTSAYLFSADGDLVAELKHSSMIMSELRAADERYEYNVNAVSGASFSNCDSLFLTYSSDGIVKIWDYKGRQLIEFSALGEQSGGFNGGIDVWFSECGKYIYSSVLNVGQLKWNLKGERIEDYQYQFSLLDNVVYSKDSSLVAVYRNSREGILLLDSESWEIVDTLKLGRNRIANKIIFDKGNRFILAIYSNGSAGVWTVEGDNIANLVSDDFSIESGEFSNDASRVLTVTNSNELLTWMMPETIFELLESGAIVPISAEKKATYQVD